jgi:hypothetical protein
MKLRSALLVVCLVHWRRLRLLWRGWLLLMMLLLMMLLLMMLLLLRLMRLRLLLLVLLWLGRLLLQLYGGLRLDFWPWAARHASLRMLLSGMLGHLRLRRCWIVRHHDVRLRRHRLLRMVCMMSIWRVSGWSHRLVLRLRLVVHGLWHMLGLRLAVYAPMLVVLRG